MKKVFLSLVLVLFVSGCVNISNIPFLNALFPGADQNVETLGPDVITIENIQVIPSSTIRPNDGFSVFFNMINYDEVRPVNDVSYELYDTGVCKYLNSEGIVATLPSSTADFSPKESKLVEWSFRAPSEDEIAGLMVNCPIRFKATYNYESTSQVDVLIIDQGRLTELQRSGNDFVYTPSVMVGRGPLKIYFDFGNTLPVKENSWLTFYIRVKDEGAGSFDKIPMDSGDYSLSINADGFDSLMCVDDYFTCSGTSCSNTKKDIAFINKETFDIRCNVTTPEDIGDMEVTKYITARFTYDYDVLGQATVRVSPHDQ